ncbi:DNA repair protein RadC [Ameyamaea chiangmaiensis NBRC 103196]|uniref:DNA repair protein RadC n=1 Tax=Ameyamaea chiangmaiensis TaxID=442969 RepID=A0A850P7C1_9PROT|nr:DNA repair protein RadC [Ameyamaea chiangmaiensis]MBS4073778.1 DNA repair protein RadC [Ameyamaea chiangmaiensis]NVN40505.1 DNA repair protein RadC [Ameyamaea chiangmaiensis]GBQ68487.1 DNA repair protein RadC [Ameyamaea chiangmaiensis NBRC 103196]
MPQPAATATGLSDVGFNPKRLSPGISAPASTKGQGPDDATLVRALLAAAMPAHGSVDAVADVCLSRFGSYAGLLSAPPTELRTLSGLGPHALSAIRLMHEAALRLVRARIDQRDVLADQSAVIDYLAAVLSRERIEQFRLLFLDQERRLIADEAQARGTVNHTPVYPREVAHRAVEHGAATVILVHNHPTGDPTPSEADLVMTRQIVAACAAIGVGVTDHIIMGNGRWLSFAERGLIDQATASASSGSV